jgi:uncharacterized membrane protein YdjX (TVP38/TMEM64 family)
MFKVIDEAINIEGWKIILILRLIPIFPFNILNYALSITSIKLWQYIVFSWIGMLPGTVLYGTFSLIKFILVSLLVISRTSLQEKLKMIGGLI